MAGSCCYPHGHNLSPMRTTNFARTILKANKYSSWAICFQVAKWQNKSKTEWKLEQLLPSLSPFSPRRQPHAFLSSIIFQPACFPAGPAAIR